MEKRAPCLRVAGGREMRGSISWEEHLETHEQYLRIETKRPFKFFSAERLAQLGGFGYDAVTALLGHPPTTWRREKRQKQ